MAIHSISNTFLRKTVRVGNSSGVLLPKSLLGADVKVIVINRPINIKKDIMRILNPILEDILGVYLIEKEDKTEQENEENQENMQVNRIKKKIKILAVATKINRHIEKGIYLIDIVPLAVLKKSIKTKKETKQKIKSAETILNRKLLAELRK